MGLRSEFFFEELIYDERLKEAYEMFDSYINFRFDYMFRASINIAPSEPIRNVDFSAFDPSRRKILPSISNSKNKNNITILRHELKALITEENLKRKEMSILEITEEGLRKNICHIKEIIKIKETYIADSSHFKAVRSNAKGKIQRDLYKTNKKLNKIVSEFTKADRTSHSNIESRKLDSKWISCKVRRYENKMKRMTDLIQLATESQERLIQYEYDLQTSRDRLTMFSGQLKDLLKHKEEIRILLLENENEIHQLKTNLSNFGILSSIEKSRVHTSSNLLEDDSFKREFLNMQEMRNAILSTRPKGMFNPKYQKVNSLTKKEIRTYLENDEAIDTVDYLIELKNNKAIKNETSVLESVNSNSNEIKLFVKCLSISSKDEIKKLLVRYYIKVVDLKECGRESDELISKLDEINDRQRRDIGCLKNDFQHFHLSFEKKFTSLKKHYEEKLNLLFQVLQEECTAITVFKLRDEINMYKKKISQLENKLLDKTKAPISMPERQEQPQKSSEKLDTSKSESESVSSTKVTYHKNKLKIQRTKPKN